MIRKFKPGDRVRKRGKKEIMIIQKYCLKKPYNYGYYTGTRNVECVWYENGIRKKGVFDQRTLTKVSTKHSIPGLYSFRSEKNQVRVGN